MRTPAVKSATELLACSRIVLKPSVSLSSFVARHTKQALTEAYAAKHSGASVDVGDNCACSIPSDSSRSQELSRRLDVTALDYISAVPFVDNEFFELIRALEQPRERQGAKEPIDSSGVQLPDGTMCEEPDVALECVLTSQAYRTLAEQSVAKGLAGPGANFFNEAINHGSAYLPGRYAAIEKCSFNIRLHIHINPFGITYIHLLFIERPKKDEIDALSTL